MARNKAYREAEQKTNLARRLGAKELDLSPDYGCSDSEKLTELPESLGRLTQLQSLDLSDNRLTALPQSLGRLTHLQSLDLSDNRLTALPQSLGRLTHLRSLNLSYNQLTALPEWLGQLTQLQSLNLSGNQLLSLPESMSRLTQLHSLNVSGNQLTEVPCGLENLSSLKFLVLTTLNNTNRFRVMPDFIRHLRQLEELVIEDWKLSELPTWLGELVHLKKIRLMNNRIADLPSSMAALEHLTEISIANNPLNPELAAAEREGLDAVIRFLRAKAEAQVVLNEAKLILIGEGEVGKSCLLGALRGDSWEEGRPTTHGIEIKPVKVTDPTSGTEITLKGWDFGGQRVYRPTHQLFFSAPAVYLVVWKPREGPQQGFVKEWIKLVKHREPDAKILVVATHGGPKDRQPDIDRQEIWDLFGKEMVIDFFHADSQPPEKNVKSGKRTGECTGIKELKTAIARVAASLPEMGRTFPKHWQEAREALGKTKDAYLPLEQVLAVCKEHKVDAKNARLLLRICHRVGDLIHYEHDPALRDIVILKPDWLATAISYVLDDKETRDVRHGLVSFERLGLLWNDPARPEDSHYEASLHPLFVRLMERFDLSYKAVVPDEPEDALGFWQHDKSLLALGKKPTRDFHYTSLIAQLVPDVRPNPVPGWPASPAAGDEQQTQICRIVEAANGQSATAEGLFYKLIVRLHKYSLGRANFKESVHWQRGLLLEDDTGARAFLEHIRNDVRVTVRSPYPERFLSVLTYEVKWLVECFWVGLRCEVTVPCLVSQANRERCSGLFEVGKLLENKKRGRPEQPCPTCNQWQSIDQLLRNAPAARPNPLEQLLENTAATMRGLNEVRRQLGDQRVQIIGRLDRLDAASKEIISRVEDAYTGIIRTLRDEAKEGPRLFSFEPVEPGFWDRPKWINTKYRITLWCEHSRLPLPALCDKGDKRGVYEVTVPRDWVVKSAPFLKLISTTLSLVLPVASSALKVSMDDATYKGIENQLGLGEKCVDAVLKAGGKAGEWLAKDDSPDVDQSPAREARGAVLRQFQVWLKEKDPSFGGLVRVLNKRHEFLWVHPQFEGEY
jgi:hypothetical protein